MKKPLGLLDWRCGPIDKRCGCPGHCTEMSDRRHVVIQEKSHGKSVDVVVSRHRRLLQNSRELANSRARHVGKVDRDGIIGAQVRRDDVRGLRDDSFDFSQSVVRTGRNAQRGSPSRKSAKTPVVYSPLLRS